MPTFHRQKDFTFETENVIGGDADIPNLNNSPIRIQPRDPPSNLQIFSDVRAGKALEINDSDQIAFCYHMKLPVQFGLRFFGQIDAGDENFLLGAQCDFIPFEGSERGELLCTV